MELAYVFLAKYADTAPDGTFALIAGGFETAVGATLPITVPAITVVARVLVPPEECGREYNVQVELFTPGEAQPRLTANLHLEPRLDANRPDRPVGINCLVGFFALTFAQPGDCEFRLSVDGRPLGRATLSVIRKD